MTGPIKRVKLVRNRYKKTRVHTRYFSIHVAGDGRARQTLRVIYQRMRVGAAEQNEDARTEN